MTGEGPYDCPFCGAPAGYTSDEIWQCTLCHRTFWRPRKTLQEIIESVHDGGWVPPPRPTEEGEITQARLERARKDMGWG